MHPALISLGFLQYVAERVSRGECLLFTKETSPGRGPGRATVGDAVSKWWSRLQKTYGIKATIGRKKALKSFRPTVITRFHAAGVDGETRRQLTGHYGKDVHEQVYLSPSLPVLKAAIEKLQYPDVVRLLLTHP